MTVAARKHGHALALCCKNGLAKGFQIPALDQQGVEVALPQPGADLRRVAAREVIDTGLLRDVGKKMMGVARQQVDIPIEGNAEPCLRLVRRAGTMGEKDGEVDPVRQDPK